ncbi:MAG: AmmeMemoRadiSam system protein B [Treponema sp.]|jgi:AmmeMemoRadiSam system protein B|nr:AmmeMemoRadiSam system protein B [Treponema sp.]
MTIREYSLPAGWYPRIPAEIGGFLAGFALPLKGPGAIAAVAPHAGWFYSGRVAARAVSSLSAQVQTVAVIGGHLPAGMPPLFALEDGVRTPQGIMPIDSTLRDSLMPELDGAEDRCRDNTVETLLPMVRHFFPKASLVWLRLPAEIASFEAGALLAKTAAQLGRTVAVLASTDLTHYGVNYGFSPKGGGPEALRWVREVNDANFIHAVEEGKPAAVLERAEADCSACSAGAVLGAMGFAAERRSGSARLLEYATSADVVKGEGLPDSFVGYAAFAYPS